MSSQNAHAYYITGFAVLKNGYVLSGSIDRFIRIWNPEDFTLVNSLKSDFNVQGLCIVSNDNEENIASVHEDEVFNKSYKSVRLWKPTKGLTPTLLVDNVRKLAHTDRVLSVTFLVNTNSLASGSADKTIIIWDLIAISSAATPAHRTLTGHTNDV